MVSIFCHKHRYQVHFYNTYLYIVHSCISVLNYLMVGRAFVVAEKICYHNNLDNCTLENDLMPLTLFLWKSNSIHTYLYTVKDFNHSNWDILNHAIFHLNLHRGANKARWRLLRTLKSLHYLNSSISSPTVIRAVIWYIPCINVLYKQIPFWFIALTN